MSPLLNGRVLAHYCNSPLTHYHEAFVCEVQWSRARQLALPQLICSAICLHFHTASHHYFTSLRGSKVVFIVGFFGRRTCLHLQCAPVRVCVCVRCTRCRGLCFEALRFD